MLTASTLSFFDAAFLAVVLSTLCTITVSTVYTGSAVLLLILFVVFALSHAFLFCLFSVAFPSGVVFPTLFQLQDLLFPMFLLFLLLLYYFESL